MKRRISILAALALASTATAAPLKVYILCGQSNMQGHAHVRTMDVIGLDPKTAPMLQEMRHADGSDKVCKDVWISSIGSSEEEKTGNLTVGFGAEKNGPKIGPEFTFGIYMQKHVQEPILIIKTAWGGKSIHTDFRPPSAGPFEFPEAQLAKFKEQGKDIALVKAEKAAATGKYYRMTMEHVKKVLADPKRVYPGYDAKEGYELAGFVWFQGWNDMVNSGVYPDRGKPGGYDAYSEALAHFIRDVRKDLDAPKMTFVIGVMGAGGPVSEYGPSQQRYAGIHSGFRKAMAAPADLPEFKGNVTAVWTENYWDMELTKLRTMDREIQKAIDAAIKVGGIDKGAKKAEIEKARAKAFNERQREILTNGASNAEFHYLGSAKILGQIGKAFAGAIAEMP